MLNKLNNQSLNFGKYWNSEPMKDVIRVRSDIPYDNDDREENGLYFFVSQIFFAFGSLVEVVINW